MDLIKEPGHVNNRFSVGNPATGQQSTRFGAKWPNDVQDELVNLIEAAGLTLDAEDQTQLLQAVQALSSQGGIRFSLPGLMAAANPAGGLRILAKAGAIKEVACKLDGAGASADVTIYNAGSAVHTFTGLDAAGAAASSGLANTTVADLADITIGVANLSGSPANLRGYVIIG